jgi:acyl-[acyl-carrier-protein]-phospholipid O-acyltransferase/long-chain-fatty-acid--[acyl-carrier-protein] ligase
MFHSFGFMSLWFALENGMPIVFHPNPLDGAAVGGLVQQHTVTILLATPTFLSMYLRRCTPNQFGSLRIVLAGAEKLSDKLATAFEEKFGVRPLEGYGATECSPVIATSVPSFRAPGFFQQGSRRGSVGPPVPGMAIKIVDPDTHEPLPAGEAGLLMVRGPNVMRGYLGRPDLTDKVLQDGWYETGDIAMQDKDGFLSITDRLSRFSKIGGEMVPHGRIEDALHEAYPQDGRYFAVTAVPDERKGERLAVLTVVPLDAVPALLEGLAAMGLPNLYIPRKDSFVFVDEIPVLGTGKTDLRAVRTAAKEALL